LFDRPHVAAAFFKESVMNRMFALFGGALVATSLSIGAFAHNGVDHSKEGKKGGEAKQTTAVGEDATQVTVTGELIDTACFVASDGDAKGSEHAECASKCMASGIPAGLLPEGKEAKDMMFLLTNPTVLAPYAAQTIKVEGTTHPDMHAIDVKKLYVQDGENWKEVQLQDEHHNMSAGGGADGSGTGEAGSDGHTGHSH